MFFFESEKGQAISKEIWEKYVQDDIEKRAERLKEAVRIGGGGVTVARKIAMPMPTLNNYLAGRDMKASSMILLARAAGVSLDWLATGEGSPTGGGKSTEEPKFVIANDLLDAPANFYVLDLLLRTCQLFFNGIGKKPTLREVLDWISSPYRHGMATPDKLLEDPNGNIKS